MRLAVRPPYDARSMLGFLAAHLCPGVEAVDGTTYTRSLALPHGPGRVELHLGETDKTSVPAALHLSDLRDLGAAIERCRRMLDADSDPVPAADLLVRDPVLAWSVMAHPGLRVPGASDGDEVALRTVLGQQVSLRAANRLCGRLTELAGRDLPPALVGPGVTRTFPSAADVASLAPDDLAMPLARARALIGLATAVARGDVRLDRSVDRRGGASRSAPPLRSWTLDRGLRADACAG